MALSNQSKFYCLLAFFILSTYFSYFLCKLIFNVKVSQKSFLFVYWYVTPLLPSDVMQTQYRWSNVLTRMLGIPSSQVHPYESVGIITRDIRVHCVMLCSVHETTGGSPFPLGSFMYPVIVTSWWGHSFVLYTRRLHARL